MTSPENPIETAAIETHEEEEDVLEGEEEEEELEALEDERLEQNEHHCAICQEKFKDPKILTCLHVFCRECVEKQLAENRAKAEEENDGQQEGEEGSGRPSTEGEQAPVYIECKICKDITRLPKNGIDDLQTEYVMAAILDMSSIADLTIVCTSCKAKEKATARCNDCVSFLCPNCVTAHQFMRCFENHKVVSFADLHKNGGVIHKPIFCPVHPTESLKCYCNTCQVAVCGECILTDHQTADHHCEKISDIDKKTIEEVLELVGKARNLGEGLHETSSNLQVTLADLQLHKESAIGLIRETFHSYKAMLEKKKDEMLENVEEMHKGLELALLDKMHNTAVTQEKIEDACKFANRTATLGEPVHVMMQKKLILKRLETLMKSLPKHEMNCSIEFQTSAESFEECLDKCFGHLVKNDDDDDDDDKDSKADTQHSSLHSSFDHDFNYAAMVSSENVGLTPVSAELASLNTLNPNTLSMSIAGSMSFCQAPPPIGSPIMGSMTLGDGSVSRNSISPAMSDSGISVDNSSTNSNNSATMFNVAVMANMAKFPHGADALAGINGQMSGLNLGLPTSSAPGARTLAPMCQAESGLLQTPSTISSSQRTQNANLENLAATLLNQGMNQGNLNLANLNLANIGSLTGLSALDGLGNMNMGASDLPGNSDPTMGARPIFGTQSDSAADFMSLGASSGLPSPGGSSNFSTGSGGNGGSFPTVRRGNKMTAMQIKFKFGQLGPGKQQFNSPHGFCLGVEEDIIVADTNNHRIQVFEKSGEFKFQFGIPGREEGQLWYPRKVAVMRSSGKYVVCDRGNERSRMQIFTKSGHFMKKIAIRYIDIVAGLAITPNGHIVAVDSVSPTVFCISESGDLIKWFDCSDYMREPSDIAINGKEYFVCDFKGHCVVVFSEEGQFLRRIGCENITNYPNGIDISDAGDVLVGDSHGNRFHVAVFQRDGSLIGEFQCPYVKVSRCCGLKISSEGYIITLAKNNHHVLVLDTLYIS